MDLLYLKESTDKLHATFFSSYLETLLPFCEAPDFILPLDRAPCKIIITAKKLFLPLFYVLQIHFKHNCQGTLADFQIVANNCEVTKYFYWNPKSVSCIYINYQEEESKNL